MLALFYNLSALELALVAILAVIVFGRRLPQVAMDGARQLYKLRRALSDMSREAGLDDEIRNIKRSVGGATRLDVDRPRPARKSPPMVKRDAPAPAPRPVEERDAPDPGEQPAGDERGTGTRG